MKMERANAINYLLVNVSIIACCSLLAVRQIAECSVLFKWFHKIIDWILECWPADLALICIWMNNSFYFILFCHCFVIYQFWLVFFSFYFYSIFVFEFISSILVMLWHFHAHLSAKYSVWCFGFKWYGLISLCSIVYVWFIQFFINRIIYIPIVQLKFSYIFWFVFDLGLSNDLYWFIKLSKIPFIQLWIKRNIWYNIWIYVWINI